MTGIRWLSKRDDIQANVEYIILRELWTELMVKWPRSYWDDWMREPAQRKGLDTLNFHLVTNIGQICTLKFHQY